MSFELERKVDFLLSLECGIHERCECEQCWKDARFNDLRRERGLGANMLTYQYDRLKHQVDREWKEVKRERYQRIFPSDDE